MESRGVLRFQRNRELIACLTDPGSEIRNE
jgi:hypothetical protein